MKVFLISSLLLWLAACGGGGGSGGGNPSQQNLSDELETIRARNNLPALTAMLIEGDRIVESGAVGIRAVGHPQAVISGDRWHIGSMTKSMTATLAARLVEQSLIDWNTTIATVFPGMVGTINTAYHNVRLDELLYHTSGLSDDIATPILPTLDMSIDPLPVQRENWSTELLSVAPVVARGTYLYTNAGYIVAGAMLEKATGLPWETLMQQEILTPLGMTSTGFGAPGTAGTADEPWGHQAQGGGWLAKDPGTTGADNPAAIGPAGTVHTTLTDYLKYAFAHLDGAGGGSAYLTAASFNKLHTPAAGTSSALGWNEFNRSWAGGTVLQHAGTNTLWYSVVWLAPINNITVFAATNAAGTDSGQIGTDEAAALLLDRYFN